jgi:capsular polysaccharide biosynthesis protein
MPIYAQVCPLIGIGAINFFHWMVEQLPRALFAEQMGYTGRYVVPVSGAFVGDSLALIGITADRLIAYDGKHPFGAEEMLFIEPFSREFVVPYAALYQALSERIISTIKNQPLAPETDLPKRIYISRSKERVVRNELELLPLLQRFGIYPFNFDHLTLPQQIRLTSQAELVMGPHGAGLTHALFMPHNSTIIEMFSPNFVNHCFLGLARLRGVRYREATAYNGNRHYPYGDDIVAPLDLLESYLFEQFE